MSKKNINSTLKYIMDTGLVKEPEEVVSLTDEPKVPAYACFASEKAKEKYYTTNQFGNGFDRNEKIAKLKSAGELLERLCLFNPAGEKYLVSQYDKKEEMFFDPKKFCCYSNAQLGKKKDEYFEKVNNEKYRWWPVKNLSTGNKNYIPAQLVFLSSQFQDEFPIRNEMISTGAALGPKGENHALKTGFLESIERDASISAYIKKKELPRITNLPKKTNDLISYLGRYQLEPHIFDMTTDLRIPSSLVVTLDRTGLGPAVCIGASSNFKHKDSIEEALMESVQWRGTSRLIRKFHLDRLPKENEIDSMTNRFFYWYSTERIKDLGFWLNSKNEVDYKSLVKGNVNEEEAFDKIKSRGYNILEADMTLPELEEKGFEGKKVLIPKIHPLFLDENARALYSEHYGELKYDEKLKPHPIS